MGRVVNIIQWIFNPFLIQRTEQVKVAAFCIIVATTAWFLNAFNKTYTTVFSFPVKYQFDKEKYIPIEALQKKVEISITGQGWELLKEAFVIENTPIMITPEHLPGLSHVSPRAIENQIQEAYERIQINEVFTDSLRCNFDHRVQRELYLKLPVDSISLGNGYAIVSDIALSPQQVFVTGPKSTIDEMTDTLRLKLTDVVDDDYDDELKLTMPTLVKSQPEEVNVRFEIAPYKQLERSLTYKVVRKDSQLVLTPSQVKVHVYVPEKYEKQLADSTIELTLDLSAFTYEGDTTLAVKVNAFPSFVKYVGVQDSVRITRKK